VRTAIARFALAITPLLAAAQLAAAQTPDLYAGMHWRGIGPTRAGRARALVGVASQPNVFYIGFDNGGVWRSTDYGSNWEPIFDQAGTGSIGAIAVAPSDPNTIYVGTGAGIIRPDLAIGDGVYKSTDGGKTWTHLGLFDTQMIAMIDVDPNDPNRLFVAALGHPYGPNAERGIFRSTDGGKSFQKVLYKDEYTSGNDVRIDPTNPNIVYAAMWEQQQSYIEGGGFGSAANGIFKSIDGGTTWTHLTEGLPSVGQANLAIAPSNSKVIYAVVGTATGGGRGGGGRGAGGAGGAGGGRGAAPAGALPVAQAPAGAPGTGLYKSRDGGDHWFLAVNDPSAPASTSPRAADSRPMGRIGGGDLPTIAVDGKNENVVYSCSTVFWRTEDGGLTWSAVRGAPGGDDYQRSWNNPNNPDIVALVSDQGGVVSGNRGKSWSSWYAQPTAAIYHVTADNSFPYMLCGGQQDSGSACVDSRSMDGEITFHDWHPVNIQEYGVAAPDPKHPDMVYASSRTGVSLYNRLTGQTTQVGPDAAVKGEFTHNVRTQPIAWSPVNADVLFYAQNAVFKTIDHGHSWTRISGDLARAKWAAPTSTGKYAANVKPDTSTGSITALAPSPRNVNVIWAGTDDGNISVTMNGGAKWTTVTPPEIRAWTRIFNMDAGHFDSLTVYAAANTLRIDDINPHFWRTHDGGKTWQEINTGIAGGAVSNSIREDPRKKGLLYAATDLQVWVSFDDGDHWQSLKLDMPPISVRDIEVKDDSNCMCADLVAGTHGRGFWILDDVTPLRQAAAAMAASGSYLFKPETAVRVRFATNDPTPWPPEMPAGENPPPGTLIDYYLASDAGQVKLEVLDGAGKIVRSYTSDDKARDPDPARDPEKYNELCKRTPGMADCGLPLYWPAPSVELSTKKGMHRWSWDMHYDPVGAGGGGRGGGGGAGGAVPHRTYPGVASPWAPPGSYMVRLTVDGKSTTQPITVRLDPRVKTPALALTQLATLTKQMHDGAVVARTAYTDARALSTKLDAAQGTDVAAFKAKVDSLAPAAAAGGAGGGGRGGRGGGGRGGAPVAAADSAQGRGAAAAGRGGRGVGRGGRGGGAAAAPATTLDAVSAAMNTAAMAMQAAEVAPTAPEVAACTKAQGEFVGVMAKWNVLRTTGLAALNAKRKAAGEAVVGQQ
jgi:hypothetical protein